MSEAIYPSTPRRVRMVIIGIDCHTRVHVAAAIDGSCQVCARFTASAKAEELEALTRWRASKAQSSSPSTASEALASRLLGAPRRWSRVRRCPNTHDRDGRRQSRRPGKDDEGDAVVIARVALRERDLPKLRPTHLYSAQTAGRRTRSGCRRRQSVRNRLHALLLTVSRSTAITLAPCRASVHSSSLVA